MPKRGLNESELAIVYQAYLEVKERVYYTSSLVDLWNQIEEVQKRMSMLHTYDSLEEDLFGNVLGDDQEDIIIADKSYLGKGASHNNDVYAMEQVQLSDIPAQHDSTVGMNHIKLNELHSMGGLFTGSGESSKHEMSDLDEALVEHMNVNPLDGVEGLVHVSEMDWTNKNIHPSKVVSLGDTVEVMVLEVDEERRRISLGLKQCKPNPWTQFAETHNKGDKVTGKIKSITDFGIFIGLEGGIDGLVHLSDISWNVAGEEAVRNYKKGDEVSAVVLAVDAVKERISLGIKQT